MTFIVVKNEKGLKYLLRNLKFCNTLSYSTDKNGHPLIGVGYDCDGGNYTHHHTIFAQTRELYERAARAIMNSYGWPDVERDIPGLGDFSGEQMEMESTQ